MSCKLEKEFKYYLDHQHELVEKYNKKFIVIKNCEIVGVYDLEIEAITKTMNACELGTFLVQKCEAGDKCHTHRRHPRVIIV